jgi:molybdopterin-guanine dinucleotide biosynthesis protein A
VAEAAAAAGVTLDGHVVAALNGDQIIRDERTPLVSGDVVFFLPADPGERNQDPG